MAASTLKRMAVIATVVLALAAAGCGSSSSSPSSAAGGATTTTTGQVHFAKTKFILHAGLAFGAFHRYIYKPWRAGDFRHPFLHKLTLIKAALAAAFIRHELGLALHDAQSSPTLSRLLAPVTALQRRFSGLGPRLRSGDVSSAALGQANSSIGSIEQQSASAGQPITEHAPSSP